MQYSDFENPLPPHDLAVETSPPPPAPLPHRSRLPIVSLLLALAGLLVLVLMVAAMHVERRGLPWVDALVVVTDTPRWDGMQPAWIRALPSETKSGASSSFWHQFQTTLEASEDGRMVLDMLAVDKQERVVELDTSLDALAPLLKTGRLPTPGSPEVLAGDLARWDTFSLDGVDFRVVGRLKRNASLALFAYLLPASPAHTALFADSPDATPAWFDEDGIAHLAGMDPEEFDSAVPPSTDVLGGMGRVSTPIALGNILGIGLVAAAAAGFSFALFRRLARRRIPLLGALCDAAATWPRTFIVHQVVFFGVFLGVMLVGVMMPLANLRLMHFVESVFREGELRYVGDAYASGNILHAAAATFLNNYVRQTLLLTLAVSLLIPFFGLLKTAASFILAGFGMAPIWSNTMDLLPFHSITIAIELEAYIVACFAVTLWPVHIVIAIVRRRVEFLARGLAIVGSTAIVTAILLALAGLYEAGSLILLRF